MTFKQQLKKLKENWLIIVLIVVLFLFSGLGSNLGNLAGTSYMQKSLSSVAYDSMGYGGYAESNAYYNYGDGEDFAPDAKTRIKVRRAWMTTEVENGEFESAQTALKNIISSDSIILIDENVNKHVVNKHEWFTSSYQIKVDTTKYDEIVERLKQIGEVQSFNENTDDITGEYTDLEIELEVEKERLTRYQSMYDEAVEVSDKIELNDRIFNQERTIKYLQDRIDNLDKTVKYSSVTISLNEKRSDYTNVVFVKISELIETFVGSLNSVLYFLFGVVPWAVLGGIIYLIYRLVKKKK